MSIILQDKFFGCICGCHIGSAMGAPVEGMTYEEIDRKYGYVDGYLPYQHYGNGWDREPGTTEDGVERQAESFDIRHSTHGRQHKPDYFGRRKGGA